MAGVGLSPGDPSSYARPGMLGLSRYFQRFIEVCAMAVEDPRLMGCYTLSTGKHLPVDTQRNTPANCNLKSRDIDEDFGFLIRDSASCAE
jgi:hypothetical protein